MQNRLGSNVKVVAAIIGLGVLAGCAGNAATPTVERPEAVDDYIAGVIALESGQKKTAVDRLEAAVAQNPELRMAQRLLGDIYREEGLYREAVPHYEALLELDPYTLRNYYNLGVTHQLLNELQQAADVYVRGIEVDADNFDLNFALGQVFLAMQNDEEGLRYLERATRIDPDSAKAWSTVGIAHDMRGNFVFAEASYRKALELDPSVAVIRQNLAANLLSQERADEAIQLLESAVEIRDGKLPRKLLGDALRAERRFDDAVAAYDAALSFEPGFVPALNGKGLALIGQYEDGLRLDDAPRDEALALWQSSLVANPNQPKVQALVEKWGK
ncbi:MAG: tetratricopeptide repeat protein [Planctomycetota bacterium]